MNLYEAMILAGIGGAIGYHGALAGRPGWLVTLVLLFAAFVATIIIARFKEGMDE